MKRLLLVNLEDCPENMHFQQAALRAARKLGIALDVAHGFEFHYGFMSPEENRTGVTSPVFTSRQAKEFVAGKVYEAAVFLDLPLRADRAEPYISLLLSGGIKRKRFVANHLAPMPGQSRTAGIMTKKDLFRFFEQAAIFSFDSDLLWLELGVPAEIIARRDYYLDCKYYAPGRTHSQGGYIFAAGSAGRSFAELFGALSLLPRSVRLKVSTNAPTAVPEELRQRVDVLDFNSNIHRLKELVFHSSLAVAPVKEGHINPTAGLPTALMGMALKRPVLCRETAWMRKYVAQGRTGFLYQTFSSSALAAEIGAILAMPEHEKIVLGNNARRAVLAKANLDAYLLEYLEAIS